MTVESCINYCSTQSKPYVYAGVSHYYSVIVTA
jgi:hypothetical protein